MNASSVKMYFKSIYNRRETHTRRCMCALQMLI